MRSLPVVIGMVLALARPAAACLWDNDTIEEESIGQAEIRQVVTGTIVQHSRTWLEAKVAYTQPMIDKGDARRERYDDLAVALARLGRLDEALAVLDAKDKRFPGEYTTLANRGSIKAWKGDLSGAIADLEAAVARNPDAHFGREHVQIQLLKWQLKAKQDPRARGGSNFTGLDDDPENYAFVIDHKTVEARGFKLPVVPPELIPAIVGMIRWGSGAEDPDLWFGLGLALAWQGDKQLALRAFARAERLGHPTAGEHRKKMPMFVRKWADLRPGWGRPGFDEAVAAKLDEEWKKGEAKAARAVAQEDKLVAQKKYKKAFGY